MFQPQSAGQRVVNPFSRLVQDQIVDLLRFDDLCDLCLIFLRCYGDDLEIFERAVLLIKLDEPLPVAILRVLVPEKENEVFVPVVCQAERLARDSGRHDGHCLVLIRDPGSVNLAAGVLQVQIGKVELIGPDGRQR